MDFRLTARSIRTEDRFRALAGNGTPAGALALLEKVDADGRLAGARRYAGMVGQAVKRAASLPVLSPTKGGCGRTACWRSPLRKNGGAGGEEGGEFAGAVAD